jgi:hypothetical protein
MRKEKRKWKDSSERLYSYKYNFDYEGSQAVTVSPFG